MKKIGLFLAAMSALPLVACASGAQEDSGEHVGSVATKATADEAEGNVDVSRAPAPTQACTTSQWQQAREDATAKHTLAAGPHIVATPTVTSCTYNPNSGYIVYTYTYGGA